MSSMLERYRRTPNGFFELLQLVEASNDKKKKTFFRLIDRENPSWGALLRTKMITLERFFNWDDTTIQVVLGQLPNRLIAIAIRDLGKDYTDKIGGYFSNARNEEFQYEVENAVYTEAQMDSARTTFIKKIRELIKSGHIKLEEVDPSLVYRQEVA